MAIESLPKEYEEALEKAKKEELNTVRDCHIKLEDNIAVVTIEGKRYLFPKKEIRDLFELLYST